MAVVSKNRKRKSKGEIEAIPSKQKKTEFSVASFQKRLRKEDCYQALKEFIHLCRVNKGKNDPAVQFLRGGGQLVEIIGLLDGGRSHDHEKAAVIFAALHFLFLRILTKVPEQKQRAIQVCHHLLSNHLNVIHRLLGTGSNVQNRTIVLKLLTGVVTLSSVLARDVLNYVSLTTESVNDIAKLTRPDDPCSVRTCFIQFVMAFLVEGNTSVICLLLQKRTILTSIIFGLEYDSSQLVIFVLTTLRTKLVEEKLIPKTVKLHTFNTRVMDDLLKLYKWKGPAAFVLRRKKGSEVADHDMLESEQQKMVAEAVHSLLLALCTSYQRGIAFHDDTLGTSGTARNTLVATVLKELKQPWENPLLTDLVVQIIGVCPELTHIAYSKVASVLEPRDSVSWINAVNFTMKVISSIKLSELSSLEPSTALKAAESLVIPSQILQLVSSRGLLHKHSSVRHKTALFLQSVLRAVVVAQSALKGHQAAKFRSSILRLFPSGSVLEKSWSMVLADLTVDKQIPETTVPIPSPIQQLLTLLDLLYLYQEHYPLLLEMGEAQKQLSTAVVKALDLENSSNKNVLTLQVKVIQLLMMLDTPVLHPGKARFVRAVDILLQATCKDDTLSVEAQQQLGAMLLKHRVLDPTAADVTGELGIWLHSCRAIAPSHRSCVISFLQNVLKTLLENPAKYVEQVLSVQEVALPSLDKKSKDTVYVSLADKLFQELLSMVEIGKSCTQKMTRQENMTKNESDKDMYDFNSLARNVDLSAFLMCVIDTVEMEKNLEEPLQKYLSQTLVHVLHLQADPRPFLFVVERWKSMPGAVKEYLNSWIKEKPAVLRKPFWSCTPESSLSYFLLEPESTMPELGDCPNLYAVWLLVRLATFYIAQLAEKQQLTEHTVAASLNIFETLLQNLQEITSTADSSVTEKYTIKFFNIILKHPLLLRYFTPLHEKKQITEKLVTKLLLAIVAKTEIFEKSVKTETCVLLKENLLVNISHYLKKSLHVPKRTKTLISAVKLLTLTGPEMHNLVSKLGKEMGIQPWTELLTFLLHNTCILPYAQVCALGQHFFEHLKNETNENAETWTVADAFQNYLQRFPHCVHHVPSNLFPVIACKRGLALASVILHHKSSYVDQFVSMVEEENSYILTTPEVLCPLLTTACHHGPLSSPLLKTVYKQYRGNILNGMKLPFSNLTYFADQPDVVQQLIVECMDSHDVQSLCQSLNDNWKDLGLCTYFHLSVIHGLQILGGWRENVAVFVHLLLHQVMQMLEQKMHPSLINKACSLLGEHLVDANINWQNQEIHPVEDWNMLPVLMLQAGLSGSDHSLTHKLFLTIIRVLWRANAVKIAEQIFEMTVSHSRFLDIVLVEERAGTKLAVLQLVLACYQLAPHVMKPAHVPIWLGAYGATLSHSDQVILKILMLLHKNKNVNINAYRPYLWSEAAVNHYSVRSRAGMSLWRIPKATVILEVLQFDMIQNTVAEFPVKRKLFEEEPDKFVDNCFHIYIENLEPCQPHVYDPAFMVPLFSHIMAPESIVQEQKFSRFGGLALTLAALGSECGYMRTAALCVLSRYHGCLNSKQPNSRLHEQYIETIRAGIGVLNFHAKRTPHKPRTKIKPGETITNTSSVPEDSGPSEEITSPVQLAPKVPNLSATFLSRASLVLTNSLHKLYRPLHSFILAKPALDLRTVPEFIALMRPGDVDYTVYQTWFLETVQCGMRTTEDVEIANNSHLFKMLFTFFSSSLSNPHTKTLILRLVESTLNIPAGTATLLNCSLLPWLRSSLMKVQESEDGDLIIAFIRVAYCLKEHEPALMRTVVPLLLRLPSVLKTSDLHVVLQVTHCSVEFISQKHLIAILHVCQRGIDHEVVEECYKQLGISQEPALHKLKISESCDIKNEFTSKAVDRLTLSELLRNIVVKWSIHWAHLTFQTDVHEHMS